MKIKDIKGIRANTDLAKILSNTAWMVFDRVFILALNLFVSVRIANYYGALGYGSYQYAVNIIAVFEIVATFIDGRVVKKRYGKQAPEQVVQTATVLRVLLSGVSVAAGVAFAAVYGGDFEFTVMFLLLLLNMAAGSIKFGMANRFEYLLKSRKIVIASDIAVVAASCLQLIAVHYHRPVRTLALIALVSTVISIVIVYFQYRAEFGGGFRFSLDRASAGEMLAESFPLALAGSCSVLYARCDSIMLGAMLTSAEVGIYSVSVSLINVVQIAIAPVRESVYPKMIRLYEEDRQGYERRYVQISSILTWIYIAGVAFSFLILPFLFRFLNSEYAAAMPVYRIHVLGTFFMYNAALREGHFTLNGHGSILTWSQFISVGANIVMNLAGIRLWGIYGAAIATVITQAASLMFSNLFFKKEGLEVFRWQIRALNPIHIFR